MNRFEPAREMALWALALLASLGFGGGQASAVEFSVMFGDPQRVLEDHHDRIESHALAAAEDWGEVLDSQAEIEIIIRPSSMIPRASGRSVTSAFVRNQDGLEIYEQGAGAEIRTGSDPNGASPDIELTFNVDYLRNELWFDPDPEARIASPDPNRTDAMSVFLHELGHALAYNGWRDGVTGELSGRFASTFDILIEREGAHWFFIGPTSRSVWGEPLAITEGNANHLGNSAPDFGERLIPGLMNGVVFVRGARYWITALDLAVLRDVGLPVRAPVSAPADMRLVVGDGVARVEMATRTDRLYRVDFSSEIGRSFEFHESFFGDGSARTLDLGRIVTPSLFLRGGEWR